MNTLPGQDPNVASALGAYFTCVALFAIIFIAIYIWVFWRILTKAGYSGWLSLLNLVGGIGTLVLLFILAFGDWPVLQRLTGRAPYGTPPTPGGTPYAPAPPAQPYAPPAYVPPAPSESYAPPAPPAYAPPAPPAPPTYTPPMPPESAPDQPNPEPPAPPA